MKLVKRFSLLFALIFAMGIFCACSEFKYDNSTVVARVESVEGQKVVLLVGEMNIEEGMFPQDFGDGMGYIPDLSGGSMPNMEDHPSGEFPDDMQIPGGEMPEGFDIGDLPNGQFPGGMNAMQMPFDENGDKIELTLNEEIVKTLSVGSIVQVTFGDNGSVEALTVLDGSRMNGFSGN